MSISEYVRREETLAEIAREYNLTPGAVNAALTNPAPRVVGHPRFHALVDEMRRVHDSKNSDYADSATDPLRNFRACEAAGIPALDGLMARLSDKYMRACNLVRKERETRAVGVEAEKLADTLLDLACYSLIGIILYEEANGR